MIDLTAYARSLYDFCPYPAVRYNILTRILDLSEDDSEVSSLKKEFLASDVITEMADTQDKRGGWGHLTSKDYSVKAKIPTSSVGIDRCLYLGLTLDDGDILFDANEYLEGFFTGATNERLFEKNERAEPWRNATVCAHLEAIAQTVGKTNPLCDETIAQWQYIAERAYSSGEYSYENDRAAQHEIFRTHEARLVPMQSGLILSRRSGISAETEDAMLRHLGGHAASNGHFWDKTVYSLPQNFKSDKTRRWMATFEYINQFRNSSLYLASAVEWLMDQADERGLWDWGSQTKDPWGYFRYFSLIRKYALNRITDCSMEILFFLKKYNENNPQPIRRTL